MNDQAQQFIVTGSGGWLGSRLVQLLQENATEDSPNEKLPSERQIRGLYRSGEAVDSASVTRSKLLKQIEGDLTNPADCDVLCSGAEGGILLHAAGVIHPRRVREFYEINRDGTRNILEAAAKAKVKRAVIVSSNSPCGCNPTADHRFNEQSPFQPYMHYGRSKMEMEKLVHSIQETGSIETVIIRAPWFYGPFQPPRQTQFFQMIRTGKVPIVGDGNNCRSMAYIDNLCEGIFLAATTPTAIGETYWIADRRAYTMNEIIGTIEELLEDEFGIACAHKRLRLPQLAGVMATTVDAMIQSTGLYHQKIHVLGELNKNIACSIDKATSELGYEPRVDLKEGMRRSLRWCIDNGYLQA